MIGQFAKELERNLRFVRTEEDVRLETAIILGKIAEYLKINKRSDHELTIFYGGRADSVYQNIVIEYKKFNHFKTNQGGKDAFYGRNKKDRGLVDYLIGLSLNESSNSQSFKLNLLKKVGVGFDGNKFIFIRYVERRYQNISKYLTKIKNKPEWLDENFEGAFEEYIGQTLEAGLKRLVLLLRSTNKIPLTPRNLIIKFGSKSDFCKKYLFMLYNLLIKELTSKNSHVTILYNEWNRLFGIVYGDIETATTQVKDEVLKTFDISSLKDFKLRPFIFATHTYYSILLKILISNLFDSLVNPLADSGKDVLLLKPLELKGYIKDIFTGKQFRYMGVENFFEGVFFEWYIYTFSEDIEKMIIEAFTTYEKLEAATSIVKPENIGDMLKAIYHDLVPKKLRHLMGEFFTPDWLAEHVLDRLNYKGDINKTFLDPTCGSGTFLSMVIKRKRLNNAHLDHKTIVSKILQTVIGFDLNPISFISAKTNYLLALGDILNIGLEIKIPVYLCDSVLTPTVHAKQKANTGLFNIETVVGKFIVPALGQRFEIEKLLDLIAESIENNLNQKEFKQKAISSGIKDINNSVDLYFRIKNLHVKGRNGFWAVLLKNLFAPIYSEHEFDFVIGNPPWVSWKNMSKTYRESTLPIWWSYDIFNKSAYDKRTTHDDFAMAVTYVAADHFLKNNGKLGFVLSQTFFKSLKGGEGFRKFEITRDNQNIPLSVCLVDDMVQLKPFPDVANRTSVLILEKNKKNQYPVPYNIWKKKKQGPISEHANLDDVHQLTEVKKLVAIPINKNIRSPWLTIHPSMLKHINNILGCSPYRGRKGIEPLGGKGIYMLNEPQRLTNNKLKILNNLERGRLKEVLEKGSIPGIVESDLIYPAVGGRNVTRWGIRDYAYMLVPHENKKGPHNAIPESTMKIKYSKTYKWLCNFQDILFITRKRNGKFFDEKIDPFYALDNVGLYTFSPYKVIWREQKSEMTACVISSKKEGILKGKLIMTDSKVLSCSLDNEDEAHYLCAILNSLVVRYIIENYTINIQIGIDVLKNIAIPKYESQNKLHKELVVLSIDAHKYFKNEKKIEKIEDQISKKVASLFAVRFDLIKKYYE